MDNTAGKYCQADVKEDRVADTLQMPQPGFCFIERLDRSHQTTHKQ
jgi:hypothetical protein